MKQQRNSRNGTPHETTQNLTEWNTIWNNTETQGMEHHVKHRNSRNGTT